MHSASDSPESSIPNRNSQTPSPKRSYKKKKSNYLQETFNIDTEIKKSIQKKQFTVILLGPQIPRKDYTISGLFDMFSCNNFKVGDLIYYYFVKFKEQGPHQFLTNKLYDVKYEDLEFYIPQLVYLLIKNDSPFLEKFISSLCSRSIALYELISWCFVSFSDRDRQDKVKNERLARIDKLLEDSMANSSLNQDPTYSQKLRSYQGTVRLYLNNLIQMSLILKSFKAEDRKPKLKNLISRANVALEKYRTKTSDVLFQQGISLPFTSQLINNKVVHSNMVVRIIEGECTCFNTKKRVPYRIVVETIDPSELKIRKPIQKKSLSSIASQISLSRENLDAEVQMEDFLHQDISIPDKEALQQKMMEIVQTKKIYQKQKYDDLVKITDEEKSQTKTKGLQVIQNIISSIQMKRQFGQNHNNNENEIQELEIKLQQEVDKKEQFLRNLNKKKSFINAVDEEKYQINLKRFKILFPEQAIERTNSCIPKINEAYQQINQKKDKYFWIKRLKLNPYNNHKYCHKRANQVTILQRLQFFKYLQQKYPNHQQSLNKIYLSLQLDLYEKKFERQQKYSNQQELEFPRKFGPWDELWEDKAEVIKRNSPYQHFESYQLKPIIVKGGDDLRQELMTMQIIKKMQQAFDENCISLYVKAYEIIVVSSSSGLLEFCADTISIDGMKKKYPACKSIVHIYKEIFQQNYEEAQRYFIQSLAAYSIISYLLQIKDRHNGNILIDSLGRLIHIDFGFILCTSPGNVNFEKAPFKLTQEYIDMMNGVNSDLFNYFKSLLFQGFRSLRGVVNEIILLIEIMMLESDFPCFEKFDMKLFRDRFQENASDESLQRYVDKLINQSLNNWRTIQYDNFQRMTNGIMP